MRKKRTSDKNTQPEQTSVTTDEPSRRPSRRAALEAAKKIYNSVRNYDVKGSDETPLQLSTTSSEYEQKSKKRRDDIGLEMHCEEEVLSVVQSRFQREAVEAYNLTMRNLRQLQACNARIIEERPNTVNVRAQPVKTNSMPPPKSLIRDAVYKKLKDAPKGTTPIIYV